MLCCVVFVFVLGCVRTLWFAGLCIFCDTRDPVDPFFFFVDFLHERRFSQGSVRTIGPAWRHTTVDVQFYQFRNRKHVMDGFAMAMFSTPEYIYCRATSVRNQNYPTSPFRFFCIFQRFISTYCSSVKWIFY